MFGSFYSFCKFWQVLGIQKPFNFNSDYNGPNNICTKGVLRSIGRNSKIKIEICFKFYDLNSLAILTSKYIFSIQLYINKDLDTEYMLPNLLEGLGLTFVKVYSWGSFTLLDSSNLFFSVINSL